MAALEGGGPTQVIRQPVGYLNPRSKPAPYVVNLATGERTPGVVFDATGALAALVPAAGSPEPGASGLWLPDSVADAAAPRTPATRSALQLAAAGRQPGAGHGDGDRRLRDRCRRRARGPDRPLGPTDRRAAPLARPRGGHDTAAAAAGRGHRHLPDPGGRHRASSRSSPGTWRPTRARRGSRTSRGSPTPPTVLRDELEDPSSDLYQQVKHRGSNPVSLSTGLPGMVAESPRPGCTPRTRASPPCASSPRGCPGWSSPWPRSRCSYAGAASARCWSSRAAPRWS